MIVEQFSRKSFPVDAVRVTLENLEQVAKWCDGQIHDEVDSKRNPSGHPQYIKVRVENPLTERQTMAFVGDWVLYAGKGYKVYTDKAFRKSFDKKDSTPREVIEANVFGGGAAGATTSPPTFGGIAGGTDAPTFGGSNGGGTTNPGGTSHIG